MTLFKVECKDGNVGVCENCYLEGVRVTEGKRLNPENNLVDKWRMETPGVDL